MSINSMTSAAIARRPDMGVFNATPANLQQIAAAARTTPSPAFPPVSPSTLSLSPTPGAFPQQAAKPTTAAGAAQIPTPNPAAGGSPAPGTMETALNTLFGYIPTEIVTVYVAFLSVFQADAETKRWMPLIALVFLLATPTVVWITYATKLKGAGKPVPTTWGTLPVWEMTAAAIAFCAWAIALPHEGVVTAGTLPTGMSGLLILVTSTALGLLSPLVQRPLST